MRIVLRNLSAPRRAGSPVPGGLFPGALLTVWAHLRQTLFDAQHYDKAMRLEAALRGDASWPESERTLQSLQAVARGDHAARDPARAEREVQRCWISWTRRARARDRGRRYEAASLARRPHRRQVPVLVSLNFPRKKASAVGQVTQFIQAAGTPDPEDPVVHAVEAARAPEPGRPGPGRRPLRLLLRRPVLGGGVRGRPPHGRPPRPVA
jgi:hypothetical protein